MLRRTVVADSLAYLVSSDDALPAACVGLLASPGHR